MIPFTSTQDEMTTTPFKLLYVCNGNTARSPVAAACTAEVLGHGNGVVWDIDSAGTHAVDGDVLRPEAQIAADALDLDLSAHRAKLLTPERCLAPDLVLATSWEEVSHIWSVVPEAWDKVFTIKEFVHWAQRAPVRPPILFPDPTAAMRDKLVQAHAVRKRARADHGFWGGIRPQDLNLIEPNGKGEEAWTTLALAVRSLVSDVILLLRGPQASPKAAHTAPKRSTRKVKARR
jgi:protein-tyrosine-phosphatase